MNPNQISIVNSAYTRKVANGYSRMLLGGMTDTDQPFAVFMRAQGFATAKRRSGERTARIEYRVYVKNVLVKTLYSRDEVALYIDIAGWKVAE